MDLCEAIQVIVTIILIFFKGFLLLFKKYKESEGKIGIERREREGGSEKGGERERGRNILSEETERGEAGEILVDPMLMYLVMNTQMTETKVVEIE